MILTVSLNAAVDKTYIVETFAPGRIHVVDLWQTAGGKANNVARVLHRLGEEVVATGLAGGGHGQFILGELARLGLRADYETHAAENRACITLIERESGRVSELRERGPEIPAAVQAAFLARYRRLVRQARLVVISGSLPPGMAPDYYGTLVREARVPVLLDAGGDALREGVQAGPLLVKPNREELAAIGGDLQALPVPYAVVSLGPEGCLARTPAGVLRARPPAVTAVNTVGSGDAMVAGMAAALRRGLPPAEVLRWGVACGTASVLQKGVAEPDPADVQRLLPQVSVERL